MKKNILILCGIGESLMGIALLFAPSLIGWLLFGEELQGVAEAIARLAGIALLALGIACWSGLWLWIGILFYNTMAMLYLTYVGLIEHFNGILLWPAVILHGIMTIVLVWRLITK